MTDFERLIRTLPDGRVEFIILSTPIRMKRAAGRPRDLEAVAELEAILEERDRPVEG